jgi:hypothetical protein
MPGYLEKVWKTLLAEDYVVTTIFTFPDKKDTQKLNLFFDQMEKFVEVVGGRFPKVKMDFDDKKYQNAVEWTVGPVSDQKAAEQIKKYVESYLRAQDLHGVDFSVTIA